MDISSIVLLLGGVAMFLFGMSLMGDGLCLRLSLSVEICNIEYKLQFKFRAV